MKHFRPEELSIPEVFGLLLAGVAPRPIALVATLSENGTPNLSPFSFFNAFGSNPPYVAFSPSTRVRDGSKKHTYYNLLRERECTIQAVSYDMVEQVNLASAEFLEGVDEFVKSGLTPVPSDLVKAPMVKESPFRMECVLEQEIALGNGMGSGNLMICRVLKFHVAEAVYDGGEIDPQKLDLVARMGGNFYCRAGGDAVFEVEKPLRAVGMGYDLLPDRVKYSQVLSANNLAHLAGAEKLPSDLEVKELALGLERNVDLDDEWDLLRSFERCLNAGDYEKMLSIALHLKERKLIELAAKTALENHDREFAWKALML